jgi:hypothetical protein
VLTVIRDVANAGHAVISTIHQPATEVFEMFDNLLLLQRGGRTVYMGPLGPSSAAMTGYFARNGAVRIASSENPADYMLREADSKPQQAGVGSWADVWLQSSEHEQSTEILSSAALLSTSASVSPSAVPFSYGTTEFPGAWYRVCVCLSFSLFQVYTFSLCL